MNLNAYVREPNLQRGEPIDDYISLTVTPRFNDVGTWMIDLSRTSIAAEQLMSGEGYGIIVERNNKPLMAGTYAVSHRSWKANGSNTLTLTGPDDNIVLARRLIQPSDPPFTASDYDYSSGLGEAVMRHYVAEHCGAAAATVRQVPGLTLQPDSGLGTYVEEQGRFQTVIEMLQRISYESGGLGFKVVQVGSGIQFHVYESIDRSNDVVFGPANGNLQSFEYETQAPTANYIYVGGGGEGTSRVIAPDGDWVSIAKWGRREAFRDRRDTTDPTALNQTITEEIEKNAEKHSLQIVPAEYEPAPEFTGDRFTPFILGVDYDVGDQVAVDVDGVRFVDRVRSAEIKVSGPALTTKPLIGTSNASSPESPDIFDEVRALKRQIRALEAR